MRRHLLAAIAAMLFTLCVAGTAAASGLGDPVGGQSNDSDQGQAQIVPIAPQANVQNVNIGSKERDGDNTTSSTPVDGNHEGSVEQGNADNANTGQADEQENTQKTDGGQSQTSHSGQSNKSDQDQIQVVPIAPQANVQNVNVATQGDVKQGNANNANTGQADQQENTTTSGSGGREHSDCGCDKERSSKHESSKSGSTSQSNRSEQEQVQIVPIAPQANVQNVNVATQGDVGQGNANNANTGQANQQENTAVAGHGEEGKRWDGRCEKDCSKSAHESSKSGSTSQSNRSEQKQVQFIPIAPQLNVQNVNLLTFGDVEQGNANNANTGQANQQENTAIVGHGDDGKPGDGGIWNKDGKCDSGCYQPTKWSSAGPSVRQSNWSEQKQLQFIPIAPQLNVQNVNVATFGDVEQGNANNANTGQANQQSNSSFGSRVEDGEAGHCYSRCDEGRKPQSRSDGPRCKPKHESERERRCKHERKSDSKPRCTSREKRDEARKPSGQSNWNEQKQFQFIPIAPQANVQNVNVLTFGDVEQGNANNANTGQANQQSNTVGSPNHDERREAPAPPPAA